MQIRFPLEAGNLLPLFAALDANYSTSFYWTVPDEQSEIIAFGSVAEHRSRGETRFTEAETAYHSLQSGMTVLGEKIENDRIPTFLFLNSFFSEIADSEWNGFSPTLLSLPEIMIIRREDTITACVNFHMTADTSVQSIYSRFTKVRAQLSKLASQPSYSLQNDLLQLAPYLNGEKSRWMQSVDRGIESIRHHEIDKVVLAKKSRIDIRVRNPLYETLDTLRQSYPGCITFLYRREGKTFFGATPEWFARVRNNVVTCDALAGSIGRNETPAIDTQLGEELLHSTKNLSEHKFVVQYLRRKLQAIAYDIECPDSPHLKKLRNVQHLYTKLTGELRPKVSPFNVVDVLHPTPAVGGIPSKDALKFIRAIEQMERGYYAAPLGWLSLDGDFDMAVGLRSGLLTEDALHLYAGAGIVEGSDPEAEYDELQLKLMPLLNAFQSVAIHD